MALESWNRNIKVISVYLQRVRESSEWEMGQTWAKMTKIQLFTPRLHVKAYYCACSIPNRYWNYKLQKLQKFVKFCIYIYIPWWLTCPVASAAPSNFCSFCNCALDNMAPLLSSLEIFSESSTIFMQYIIFDIHRALCKAPGWVNANPSVTEVEPNWGMKEIVNEDKVTRLG